MHSLCIFIGCEIVDLDSGFLPIFMEDRFFLGVANRKAEVIDCVSLAVDLIKVRSQ